MAEVVAEAGGRVRPRLVGWPPHLLCSEPMPAPPRRILTSCTLAAQAYARACMVLWLGLASCAPGGGGGGGTQGGGGAPGDAEGDPDGDVDPGDIDPGDLDPGDAIEPGDPGPGWLELGT